jgi:hypothetical protein
MHTHKVLFKRLLHSLLLRVCFCFCFLLLLLLLLPLLLLLLLLLLPPLTHSVRGLCSA